MFKPQIMLWYGGIAIRQLDTRGIRHGDFAAMLTVVLAMVLSMVLAMIAMHVGVVLSRNNVFLLIA